MAVTIDKKAIRSTEKMKEVTLTDRIVTSNLIVEFARSANSAESQMLFRLSPYKNVAMKTTG